MEWFEGLEGSGVMPGHKGNRLECGRDAQKNTSIDVIQLTPPYEGDFG